jgi:hypothetical protein
MSVELRGGDLVRRSEYRSVRPRYRWDQWGTSHSDDVDVYSAG